MTRWLLVAAAFLFVVLVGASGRLSWVLTPKHAYVILPPITVTEDDVQSSQWSTDGAFMLVAAKSPSPDVAESRVGVSSTTAGSGGVSLIVWDRRTRAVRKLWATDDPTIRILRITWLTGSSTAYLSVESMRHDHNQFREVYGVLSVDAADGTYAWIAGMDNLEEAADVIPSPFAPSAVAVFLNPPSQPDEPGTTGYWTLGTHGRVLKRQQTEIHWGLSIVWSADGSNWLIHVPARRTKPAYTAEVSASGSLLPVSVPIYEEVARPEPELWLHAKPLKANQRKVNRTLNNLWLSSPEVTFHPDALLTPDSNESELSPSGEAVFYVDAGVAKVRPLIRLTNDQKRDLFDALKNEALSNAKQCALGLIMYSNDADDLLPPGGGFDFVGPYIKNGDVMADFVYTPPSDLTLTKLADPATTPIGYIDGPGGRAMAYADGHVVWIPDP